MNFLRARRDENCAEFGAKINVCSNEAHHSITQTNEICRVFLGFLQIPSAFRVRSMKETATKHFQFVFKREFIRRRKHEFRSCPLNLIHRRSMLVKLKFSSRVFKRFCEKLTHGSLGQRTKLFDQFQKQISLSLSPTTKHRRSMKFAVKLSTVHKKKKREEFKFSDSKNFSVI